MTEQEIIEKIYGYVENLQIDKAVHLCLRLARKIGDVFNLLMFLRELYPDKRQLEDAFYNETSHLTSETQKHAYEITADHWINERTLGSSKSSENDENTTIVLGVGQIQSELKQLEESISDLDLPTGMGEYDTAAFTDRHVEQKTSYRLQIRLLHRILDRIRTRCLYFATRVEHQLHAQKGNINFMMKVQSNVNNYFANRSKDTYQMLQKASQLVNSDNPEDHSLLLTTVRRAIKSIADYFYPAVKEDIKCKDGEVRKMGDGQYLNRLQEICNINLGSSSSDTLLNAELDYLSTFTRKLNNIASKGVHADVSLREGKQGLIGLYLFLSNLIARLDEKES